MPKEKRPEPMPKAIKYLFLVRLINAAGSFVMPFMTMLLTVKLSWPAGRAGSFMTIMSIGGGAGMLVAGKLGDSIGRKRLIVVCQGGAALLFLACFISGIGGALPYLAAAANVLLSSTWPVFNAIVADVSPPDQRRRVYSLIYWGNNIGFSIGPLLAGFLFNRDAPLMFLVNAAAITVVSLILGFFVPETKPRGEGAALPSDAPHLSERSPRLSEAAEKGGILAVLARRPVLFLFALILALLNLVYAQHQFSLPLFLTSRLGSQSASAFGAAMTVNGLTVVACTIPLTHLFRRLSPLACMPIGALFYAAGFGILALMPASGSQATSMAVLGISTFVWTLGEVVSATNVNAFIASRSPESHRSRLNSLVSLIAQSGSMLCPLASGAFIQAYGVAAVWPAAAILGCAGGALMLALCVAERGSLRPSRREPS
jgi:MFS family permease